MTFINVAINFGYEYFCFLIYFSNIFFPQIFFQLFQNFFFEGFVLDASPFTEIKRTLCICVMKNMIYSKPSKLDFSFV